MYTLYIGLCVGPLRYTLCTMCRVIDVCSVHRPMCRAIEVCSVHRPMCRAIEVCSVDRPICRAIEVCSVYRPNISMHEQKPHFMQLGIMLR